MNPVALTLGVVLLGVGSAWAQPIDDPAAAVRSSASAEAEVARRARQVTRSAIGDVFGGVEPVPAAAAGAPDTGAPAATASGSEGAGADAAPEAAATMVDPRRDPFRPFTLDLRPETREDEILSPLQRYELPQLRLTGVIVDLLPPRAMLQDNSGMGFIVTPGTPIGRRHGVVKSIEPRRIVVEELVLDYYGREQLHQVVIEMPKDDAPQGVNQERP